MEKLTELETQMKVFKLVMVPFMGAAWTLILVLGGWIYTEGIAVSELKKETSFQSRVIEQHERKIESTAKEVGGISGDLRAIKRDVRHTAETLKEIKELLKKK